MRVLAFSGGKDSMACLHLCRDEIDVAIYVDTGKAYPETLAMVEYAKAIVDVMTIRTDQSAQNAEQGIPADVVPADYTASGHVFSGAKAIKIQDYLSCHYQNIAYPLFLRALDINAGSVIYGQRNTETRKSPARNGMQIGTITRLHPIEDWTSEQVMSYLATKMEIPEHYKIEHSSLDCYDCTAFRSSSHDRVEYTRLNYPDFYAEYKARMGSITQALRESGYMEIGNG
ncbi:MAG: phosphoadenosine phosphosulfate reductase family protein [Devosia sp.]